MGILPAELLLTRRRKKQAMSSDFTHNHKTVDLSELARLAMLQRGLAAEFPPEVLEQSEGIAGPAAGSDIPDMRKLLWCSIDNDDSRDLDQLTVAEPLDGNSTRIHIAIADVDALVVKGSPIDEH